MSAANAPGASNCAYGYIGVVRSWSIIQNSSRASYSPHRNNYTQQFESLFMSIQLFTSVSIMIFNIVWLYAQIRFLFDFFRQCLRKKRKNCAGARCYRPLSRILPHYAFFFFFFHLFFSRLIVVVGKANNAATFACKWLKAKVKALKIHLSRLF